MAELLLWTLQKDILKCPYACFRNSPFCLNWIEFIKAGSLLVFSSQIDENFTLKKRRVQIIPLQFCFSNSQLTMVLPDHLESIVNFLSGVIRENESSNGACNRRMGTQGKSMNLL